MEPDRLPSSLGADPFVETIGRDDAAALFKGFAKGREGCERLGAGVYLEGGALGILCPGVYEAPLRGQRFAVLIAHADNQMRVSRRDIEPGTIVGGNLLDVDAQLVGEGLALAIRKGETAAH